MDSYEWDIFISYRRVDANWVNWTQIFQETLHSVVQPALQRPLRVFLDDTIEDGNSWPLTLARALAGSRLLVPILSRNYFDSDWCKLELGLMMKRETSLNYRSPGRPEGLIIPLSIDDGDEFPEIVRPIKYRKFHDFGSPILVRFSPLHERLGQELLKLKDPIANALGRAPVFQSVWEHETADEFVRLFALRAARPMASIPPMTGGLS